MMFAASIDGFRGRGNGLRHWLFPVREGRERGGREHGEEGMYGRVRARGLAALTRPRSGEGRPLLSWLPVPGVWTGTCPDGTERKAGRAWGIRQKTGMARSPARHLGAFAAQAAQTRHRRYCATVIFRGMACPRMARRRASPGLLPRWDAPRAHDAAIDDHRRGGQHAQGHDLPQVGDFFHRGVTAGSGHRLADDLVRFDTFGATGTKDFDDHDAASFGRILRGSGRAGCVGLPSAVMREGRVRPMPSPA